MKFFICLFFMCFLYYKLYQRLPLPIRYNVYFGCFITICLLIYYLMNHQRQFMYKMASNVRNANHIQLHELVPDYTNSDNKNNIKYTLADKQLLRCKGCMNPIDLQYINHYKLSYTVPLNAGGNHDPSNLSLFCPTCYKHMNL
mgnify:CR=1 FL=1